jgi:hypothetical protein
MEAWAVLGIAPTADVAAIRRTYARKLKLTRPDEDPEGFQRLLRARDAALAEAAAIDHRPAAEEEPEADQDDAPAAAAAHPRDAAATPGTAATTDPQPEATAPSDADRPPTVIRMFRGPEPPARPAPPVPRIVVTAADDEEAPHAASAAHDAGFSLEARERHWATARRLADQATALLAAGRAPADAIARIAGASADLPRGPRQEVEAAFIAATGRHLRLPDGRFDPVCVAQVRAVYTYGAPVFGWLRDDQLIHTILGAREAAAFCLIGREEDQWQSGTPKVMESDARLFFAGSPRYMRVYERFRQRGRLARRFDVVAFLAPPLWAFYYRQTCLAYATLAILATAGVLMGDADALGNPNNLAAAGIIVAVHAGTALLAARFMMGRAVWSVRRARKELRYDPNRRADLMRQRGQPRTFAPFLIFLVFSSVFLPAPYVAAYVRLTQAAEALQAWLGW